VNGAGEAPRVTAKRWQAGRCPVDGQFDKMVHAAGRESFRPRVAAILRAVERRPLRERIGDAARALGDPALAPRADGPSPG
jgi:hypothetical protein